MEAAPEQRRRLPVRPRPQIHTVVGHFLVEVPGDALLPFAPPHLRAVLEEGPHDRHVEARLVGAHVERRIDLERAAFELDAAAGLAREARFGGPIYRTRPDECCQIRKIEPLKRAVRGFDARSGKLIWTWEPAGQATSST